jgi:hypothetical protein
MARWSGDEPSGIGAGAGAGLLAEWWSRGVVRACGLPSFFFSFLFELLLYGFITWFFFLGEPWLFILARHPVISNTAHGPRTVPLPWLSLLVEIQFGFRVPNRLCSLYKKSCFKVLKILIKKKLCTYP